MNLAAGWCCLGIATLAALLYTHNHACLVRGSYRLNSALEQRDALHEQCAYLEYEVMTLKAPNRLKERLTSYAIELAPPKATETITTTSASAEPSSRGPHPEWLRAIAAETE